MTDIAHFPFSPPRSTEVEPTVAQAFSPARSSKPVEPSSNFRRQPSVDASTKTTSDKESAAARDETYGTLSSEIVESIVNPSATKESRYVFVVP